MSSVTLVIFQRLRFKINVSLSDVPMRAAFRHAVLLLVFAVVGSVASQAKQLAVVVDKSNKLDAISSTDLAKILSLDTRRWQDGRSVLVILSDSNSNDVKQILQRALKLS